MQQVQTLLSAATVLPIDYHDSVLHDTTVVIDAGRIIAVLPTEQAEQHYHADDHLHLNEHVLLPGLINSHTHAAMSLLRGLGSDLPLMQWLNDYIWPREQQWVDPQYVQDGSLLAMAEMLRSGITCFNDMYFFPEVTARAALNLGMRACIGMIALDFPSPYAQNIDEYLQKGLQLHDQFKHQPLIKTLFAPHAPYTVSDASFEKIAVYANELELQVHIHLHETLDEIDQSVAEHGMRPIARLEKLGILNDGLIAVHAVHLSEQELERLATHNVHIVHCPASNLKLASGFCPVTDIRQHGISMSLGTDSNASNDALDILAESRLAALLAKGVSGKADIFPAHEALRAITIDAARGLGLDQEIGSIEVGKAADLIAISLDEFESCPFYDLASQLVYSTHRESIQHVWVAGRQLLKNRELTTVSKIELLQRARSWQQKLHS